jgi:hypothetical protein
MTDTFIAAFGVLASLWPFHPAQVSTHTYALPTWEFSQSKDRFTGRTQCDLFQGNRLSPSVSYANQSLTFAFPRKLNTLQADYRVDGGPVRRWQDAFPKLVQVGANLQNGSMTNPTGGLVSLPAADLLNAHTVTIRPTPHSQPKLFTIDGFPNALSAAEARGCAESDFIR